MAEAGYGGSLGSALQSSPVPAMPSFAPPPDDAENPAVQDAYRGAMRDFRTREADADKQLSAATQRLRGLKVPQLQQMPEEPQFHRTDPMSVWGSLAMMFAVFGSMAVKAPFTTALNAATAVMNAYNVGDRETYQRELRKWQVASQNAARMAQWEHEQYRDQLEGIRSEIEIARLSRPTVAMLNDQVVRTLIDAGHIPEAIRVMQHRGRAAGDLGKATEQAQEHMLAMLGLQQYLKDHPEDAKDPVRVNELYHMFKTGKNPDAERKLTAGQSDAQQASEYLRALQAGKDVTIGGLKITKQDYDDFVNSKGFDAQNAPPKQAILKKWYDAVASHASGGEITEHVEEVPEDKPGFWERNFGEQRYTGDKSKLRKGGVYSMPAGSPYPFMMWNGKEFEKVAEPTDTQLMYLQNQM